MRVELAPGIEARIRGALREAGQREVGGMLLGEQIAPSRFRVVDVTVDLRTGSHSAFRRDPAAHRQALDDFFRRTGRDFRRFNYLGEWHSHPSFSVQPSAIDLHTMMKIVGYPESEIAFAALLIVRLRWRFWFDHSLTIFARGRPPWAARMRPHIVRI